MFTQQQQQQQQNIKAPRHCPLWGQSPVTGLLLTQKAMTRKMFPFDDVIIIIGSGDSWHRKGDKPLSDSMMI